jgi:hypothetical protein
MVVPIFLSKETNGIIDFKHVCSQERIAEIQKHHEDEIQIVTDDLHRKLPEEVKKAVKRWTTNTTYLISHLLEEVRMNSVNLTATIRNNIEHWATRAIGEGQTTLCDSELLEFLAAGNKNIKNPTVKYFHLNSENPLIQHSISSLMFISKSQSTDTIISHS